MSIANLSVIIPVYNAEKYIEKAIESVMKEQRIKVLEIICVDDGSTDHSYIKLCEMQEKYSNISIVRQENAGVSVARNVGISRAKGKYIAFLDADDCWKTEFLNENIKKIVDENHDIVQFTMLATDEKMEKCMSSQHIETRVVHGGENEVWNYQAFFTMWYRKDFLKQYNIKFPVGLKYSEDKIFAHSCLFLAN